MLYIIYYVVIYCVTHFYSNVEVERDVCLIIVMSLSLTPIVGVRIGRVHEIVSICVHTICQSHLLTSVQCMINSSFCIRKKKKKE